MKSWYMNDWPGILRKEGCTAITEDDEWWLTAFFSIFPPASPVSVPASPVSVSSPAFFPGISVWTACKIRKKKKEKKKLTLFSYIAATTYVV